MQYLWDDSANPVLGDMAATSKFNDGSQDDTTTYETASGSLSFGAGCALHELDTYLTAVCGLDSRGELLTWRFTTKAVLDNGDNIQCNLPFVIDEEDQLDLTDHLYYYLETSEDGEAWEPVQNGEVSNFHLFQTLSGTFPASTLGEFVRVRLVCVHRVYDAIDTITSVVYLSDFRVTYSEVEALDTTDTFGLEAEEVYILIFDNDGNRLTLPQHRIIACDYVKDGKGGYQQFNLSIAANPSEYTNFSHDDKVQVWVKGICRYEGLIAEISRSRQLPDVLNISGYGLWQRVSQILTDRSYAVPTNTDAGEVVSALVQDYVIPLYPDLEIDIGELGETLSFLDARGLKVGEALENALKLVADRAVYGIDRNPETANPRFYLRLIDTDTVDHLLNESAQRRYTISNCDVVSDSADLVNRLRIRGNAPRYPNLVTNASFEDLRFTSNGDEDNFLFNPSVERSSPIYVWNLENGADEKAGGLSEGSAYHGRDMIETDGPNERFYQVIPGGLASGHTYVFGGHAKREVGATPSSGIIVADWLSSGGVTIDYDVLKVTPNSVLWEDFSAAAVPPTGAVGFRFLCERSIGSLLWDSLYFYDADSIRQTSWLYEIRGNGRVSKIDWACREAFDGGYSVKVKTTGCSDGNNAVRIKNTTKFPIVGGQSLKIGFYTKSPAGVTSNPPIKMYLTRRSGNTTFTAYQTVPAGSGWVDWTKHSGTINVPATDDLAGSVGNAELYFSIEGNGEVLIDGVYVRDAAIGDNEPYLRDGNYYVTIRADEAFTEEENADIHNSEDNYGVRFGTIDLDRNSYPEALSFAQQYFSFFAVPQNKPRLSIVNYSHRDLGPGEVVKMNGQFGPYFFDESKPLVRLSEAINNQAVLTSTLEMEFERPTPENILRRLKKGVNQTIVVSNGFQGNGTTRGSDAGDTFNGVGFQVTSLNDMDGALTITVGSGLALTTTVGYFLIPTVPDGSFYGYPTGSIHITSTGNVGGVTSFNSLTGGVTLEAGENITLSTSGNTITITSTASGAVQSANYNWENTNSGPTNIVAGYSINEIYQASGSTRILAPTNDSQVIYRIFNNSLVGGLTISPGAGNTLVGSSTVSYQTMGEFWAISDGAGNYEVWRVN